MFIVYSKPNCPQCTQAKALLDQELIDYQEVEVRYETTIDNPNKRYIDRSDFMDKFPTVRSMPLITLSNGTIVGGLTSLKTLIAES